MSSARRDVLWAAWHWFPHSTNAICFLRALCDRAFPEAAASPLTGASTLAALRAELLPHLGAPAGPSFRELQDVTPGRAAQQAGQRQHPSREGTGGEGEAQGEGEGDPGVGEEREKGEQTQERREEGLRVGE